MFAEVVNNCKEVFIDGHTSLDPNESIDEYVSKDKVKAVFEKMDTVGTKLKSLNLNWLETECDLDLSSLVSTSTLMNALGKLESLSLSCVRLGTNFKTEGWKSKLKSLEFWECDSFDIDNLLHAALDSLTSLVFSRTYLNQTQVINMVKALDKSCKLKTFDLAGMDLRNVQPKLLARVLVKIDAVILCGAQIGAGQLEEILLAINNGSQTIRILDLEEIDCLNKMDPHILATAVNKLECFSFGGAVRLTQIQTQEIFKVMSVKTNIKFFGVEHPNFYDITVESIAHIHTVDPETLAKALDNLDQVKLSFEKLNPTQYRAILQRLCKKIV